MSASPWRLEQHTLSRLFPFHVVLQAGGEILGLGPILERVLPEWQNRPHFDEWFEVLRPRRYTLDPDRHERTIFRLRVESWPLELRGQLIALETSGDGEAPVCLVATPIASEGGQLRAAGLRAHDFPPHDSTADMLLLLQTQRMALEDAQALAVELRAQKDELRRAEEVAVAAREAQSRFLAMMSHEIRTPMNGLSGMIDLLAESDIGQVEANGLQLMRSCCDSLTVIVNDILDYSKIEAGKVQLEMLAFRPTRLLDEVLNLFQESAAAKQIELTTQIGDSVPEALLGDPHRIRQILSNLISNAIKFTKTGGVKVTLDTFVYEEQARFSVKVRDTGCGIDGEAGQHLFSPFTQADASIHRKYGGTGLGLAISRDLARLMGGDLELDSSSPAGSTFALRLNLPVAPVPSEVSTREVAPSSRELSVLVAEDNPTNRLVLSRMLERLEVSYEMVEDGQAAVEAVQRGEFDLVLMDVQMPVLDGLSATRAIRAVRSSESLPILALTAHVQQEDHRAALDAGMQEVLLKPLRLQTLAEALGRYRCEDDARRSA